MRVWTLWLSKGVVYKTEIMKLIQKNEFFNVAAVFM